VPYYRKKDEYVISHLLHPTQAHLKWAFSLLSFSHKVGHSIKKPNCRLTSAIASSAIIHMWPTIQQFMPTHIPAGINGNLPSRPPTK
jgi:hypothetical protein